MRKMGSEIVHECAQKADTGFGVDILERYRKGGDEFLNHVL
jgi:hypothetical protein